MPFFFADVFTPTYVELTSNNVAENIKKLQAYGVSYPFSKYAYNSFFFFSEFDAETRLTA